LLREKEYELVEEAKQYSLEVVGITLTKHHGFNTVEQDDGWKLFCSSVEPPQFTQAGMGILVMVTFL